MLRATWFIKISSAYTTGINEAKGKKRAMADPAQGIDTCTCLWYKSHMFMVQVSQRLDKVTWRGWLNFVTILKNNDNGNVLHVYIVFDFF